MRATPNHIPATPTAKKRARSFSVLILVLGFFLLSLFGWLRFQQSIALWQIIVQIGISPGPLYLAVSGAVWGGLGLVFGVGLFFFRSWAVRRVNALVLFLAAWYWFDRLVWVRSEAAQTNTVFMAFVTVVVILYTFVVTRKMARATIPGERSHEEIKLI